MNLAFSLLIMLLKLKLQKKRNDRYIKQPDFTFIYIVVVCIILYRHKQSSKLMPSLNINTSLV